MVQIIFTTHFTSRRFQSVGMEDMFGEALLIVKDFSTMFAFNLVINLVWFQFYVLTITIIVT